MTVRTNAAITALLPDNNTREISEQDLRDFLETAFAKSYRVSVKQFGAVGDGVTNDAPAINAAIDSVAGTGTNVGGGYVIFPRSIQPYMISSSIIMKRNVILCGQGFDSMIKLANGANVNMISATTTLPMFGIRDLALHGNRANQNGDGTKVGLNIALANVNSGYGGNSTLRDALVDSFYRIENVTIVEVDGVGIWTQGASGFLRHCHVEGTNGIGIRAQTNDAEWSGCSVRDTLQEGWLCAGGSARYTNCTTNWNGSAGYLNGHGFRILSRGQHFINCRSEVTDGAGFMVQGHDLVMEGCHIDRAYQLQAEAAELGLPARGGGVTGVSRCGVDIRITEDGAFSFFVTDTRVVAGDYAANLQGIVRLNGATRNNVIQLAYTSGALVSGGTQTVQSNYTGSSNRILGPTGLTTI